MKKCFCILFVMLVVMSMTACGSDEGETITIDSYTTGELDVSGFDYENHDLSAYVTLGEYTGLTAERIKVNVTDEELETEIAHLLESYGYYEPITDRQVKEGDVVLADYAGFKDGVAFDGGTAVNQEITAAPNTGYIEGFAEAFIGQMPGVEFSFNVTFPEDYGNAGLSGQEVIFVCTVHSINGEQYIIPELTDDFVNEQFGYNTVEEFRILFRENLEKQAAYENESTMYSQLWSQVLDHAVFHSYPEGEVDRLYNESRAMYEYYADYYGVDYETFLSSYVGMTDAQLKMEAETYVQEDLVLYSLQDALGSELTEEEYTNGRDNLADMYGMTAGDFENYYGINAIRATLIWEDVMKDLAEISVITEVN